jgi:hypothetical protein
MRRLAQAVLPAVLLSTLVVALAVPAWYWNGGLIEIETTQFVRQYLDGRSTLQKIFDPHGNDLGTYQARELSYFFDYLDARVFEAFMLADRPLFVPASAIVAAVLTIFLCLFAMRHFSLAARVPAALILLVYVTNYVHLVTMGMLYRSAKPLLAPVLMATVFFLVATLHDRPESRSARSFRSRSAPVITFLLFCAMSLLDRQGFFYAVAGGLALAVHAIVIGGRRDVLLAGIAAVAAMVLYNLMVGPMLVRRINGYSPSFAYQQIPWHALVADSNVLRRSAELVNQSLASLMGGWPPAVFAVISAIGVGWMLLTRSKAVALGVLIVYLAQATLVALLVARHPPIYEYYDHRVWYYPIPFQALVVAFMVIVTGRLLSAGPRSRAAFVSALLFGVAAANVAHWDDYRRAQLRSRWFPGIYLQNDALKASFADGRPRPSLSPEFRAFFDFWAERAPALRARAERSRR